MKTASVALQNYLNSAEKLIFADLWTITLRSGVVKRYTTADVDISYGGNTYSARLCLISGATYRLVRGLEVDTAEVTLSPMNGENINGVDFIRAAKDGVFDRAIVSRDRLFMPTWGDTSLGTINLFLGEFGEIKTSMNKVVTSLKSMPYLLNVMMPRRQYAASCPFTFGDSKCGINRALHTYSSSALAGSTTKSIRCGLTQSYNYFNLGVLTFTSGKNAGLSRSVKQWSAQNATLTSGFPYAPEAGDTFTISRGCSKAISANNAVPFSVANGSVSGSSNTTTSINCDNSLLYPIGSRIIFQYSYPTQSNVAGNWVTITGITKGSITFTPALPLIPDTGHWFAVVKQNTGQPYTRTPVWLSSTLHVLSPVLTTEIPCNLDRPEGYFNGGKMQMTSGYNAGDIKTVLYWKPFLAVLDSPFKNNVNNGDTFNISPPSVAATADNTCSGYSNTTRFGGMPYVPVPETAY